MRKIEGKAVKLDINPKGKVESELERAEREDTVNRKFGEHERAIRFLLEKFPDCPDDIKKFFGVA